jgi:ABC-2 type transport system permease protein
MKQWIAFWNILLKDIKTYYLKPPNISWGIIFPIAWTLMFIVKTKTEFDILNILPGLMTISILFGTTSMLSVTITFERKGKSFDRLLLSPISIGKLMLAKTSGAILFGIVNAFIPVILSIIIFNIGGGFNWLLLFSAIILIAVTSTFLGLFISVSVSEVFEAQTFSNFFRFPMIFLCGLFIPINELPIFIKPLSYIIPITYSVDILKYSMHGINHISIILSFTVSILFILLLFYFSFVNIKRKWIY